MNNGMHTVKCSMCAKYGHVPACLHTNNMRRCVDEQEGSKTNSKGADNEFL